MSQWQTLTVADLAAQKDYRTLARLLEEVCGARTRQPEHAQAVAGMIRGRLMELKAAGEEYTMGRELKELGGSTPDPNAAGGRSGGQNVTTPPRT